MDKRYFPGSTNVQLPMQIFCWQMAENNDNRNNNLFLRQSVIYNIYSTLLLIYILDKYYILSQIAMCSLLKRKWADQKGSFAPSAPQPVKTLLHSVSLCSLKSAKKVQKIREIEVFA